MKEFNGYNEAKKSAEAKASEKLPAGAYVCKVLGVRYEEGTEGKSDSITVQFDITEGEYKGFFKKQYDANENEDKKYKGKTSIYVPSDDGSERDKWTKRSFAGWTSAFEKSNKGYAWDWDEQKWKGKVVGIVFGTTGTVIEGKEVTYTEARFAVPADDARSGKAPLAKFKAKNGYTGNGTSVPTSTSAPASGEDGFLNSGLNGEDEELPF